MRMNQTKSQKSSKIPFIIYKSAVIFGAISLFVILNSCGGGGDSQANDDKDTIDPQLTEYDIDQERVSAVEFNNELSHMQNDMFYLSTELLTSDSSNIDANLENMLFDIEIKLDILSKKKFDGTEDEFVAAMVDLMNFYKGELNGEFLEMVPLIKKSNRTESDLDKLDAYDLKFVQEEEEAFNKVFAAQETFAKEHNIKLEAEM